MIRRLALSVNLPTPQPPKRGEELEVESSQMANDLISRDCVMNSS